MNITTEKVKNGNGRLHTNESECIKYKFKWEVAVVTGAGGVLCGALAKALARAGAKVALLNRSMEKAEKYTEEILAESGTAKAYPCNVLDKSACLAVAEEVQKDFGPCDILVNGAGGNNPKATTDMEYFEPDSIEGDLKSFFGMRLLL